MFVVDVLNSRDSPATCATEKLAQAIKDHAVCPSCKRHVGDLHDGTCRIAKGHERVGQAMAGRLTTSIDEQSKWKERRTMQATADSRYVRCKFNSFVDIPPPLVLCEIELLNDTFAQESYPEERMEYAKLGSAIIVGCLRCCGGWRTRRTDCDHLG